MPNDDDPTDNALNDATQDRVQQQTKPVTSQPKRRSFFTIPPQLKRIFDQYPLVTYAANDLPIRTPKHRDEHVLHVFTTVEDAKFRKPSFNPSCLRWQTYLKMSGVDFRTVPSSNHASPSGVLPFLLPAVSQGEPLKAQEPVQSNKLRKWVASRQDGRATEEHDNVRYEAYASMLEGRVRKAWLYQLYLDPRNRSVVDRLYVAPCSSHPLVQSTILYQLRSAAEAQLSSASSCIIEADLLKDADEAFYALSVLLGTESWFFGRETPGLFDASVFAYTHLLLDEDTINWEKNRLGDSLKRYSNLVQHRNRIAELYQ